MKTLLEIIRIILRSRSTGRMMTAFASGIAAVVVFVTTYAPVLPAITLEQNASYGIPEHQHTEACYEEAAAQRPLMFSRNQESRMKT